MIQIEQIPRHEWIVEVMVSATAIFLGETRETIPSMPHSLWLALVTMTTVGCLRRTWEKVGSDESEKMITMIMGG